MNKPEKIYIYGKHALMEALRNAPHAVKKVFLASQSDAELMKLVNKAGIVPSTLGKGEGAGDVDADKTHQGVIGLVSLEKLVRPYESFIKNLEVTKDTALVLMGELQDPHNVGAVIRSAAALDRTDRAPHRHGRLRKRMPRRIQQRSRQHHWKPPPA